MATLEAPPPLQTTLPPTTSFPSPATNTPLTPPSILQNPSPPRPLRRRSLSTDPRAPQIPASPLFSPLFPAPNTNEMALVSIVPFVPSQPPPRPLRRRSLSRTRPVASSSIGIYTPGTPSNSNSTLKPRSLSSTPTPSRTRSILRSGGMSGRTTPSSPRSTPGGGGLQTPNRAHFRSKSDVTASTLVGSGYVGDNQRERGRGSYDGQRRGSLDYDRARTMVYDERERSRPPQGGRGERGESEGYQLEHTKSHRQKIAERSQDVQMNGMGEKGTNGKGGGVKGGLYFALVLLPLSCWYTRGGKRLKGEGGS